MNHQSLIRPDVLQPIAVTRHAVDWEGIDLDDMTAERATSLGRKLAKGCWYLNPRFTVFSPIPTAEFFAKVIELRSAWLRTCRQSLSNHGQRSEARKLQRQGRLASVPDANQQSDVVSSSQMRRESSATSRPTAGRRREVVQAGHLARNLAFSGVLFIDGDLVPPRTWQSQADKLLASDFPPTSRSRAVTAAPVASVSSDPEPLI